MPRQQRVDVLERALAQHVGLADAGFFSGRAKQLDRALDRARRERLLDGNGAGTARRAEYAVAAAMTSRSAGPIGAFR
jgi:hypothetical protein